MPRTDSVRAQVKQFVDATPFQPFAMILENGQQLVIGHPENIAFDPSLSEGARGWDKFSVISGELLLFSTFGAVTSINMAQLGRTMKLKVVLHAAEEGGYWAEVPGLPGCVSEGDTYDETLANIREAAEGWLEVAAEQTALD